MEEYKFHCVGGASFFTKSKIMPNVIAYFNEEFVHSAPLSLNLVHNAIVRAVVGENRSFRVTNSPLEMSPTDEALDEAILEFIADYAFNLCFPFVIYIVMTILAAKYTSFYIEVS